MNRFVIKLGTGILSRDEGRAPDPEQFARLASEIAGLREAGVAVVLVSSGAVASGVSVLGLRERPTELAALQACAAVGQPALMRLYAENLGRHQLHVAQLLLSHSDIDSRMRRNNARNTLEHLLAAPGIVPIVNENDSVAVEELRFGDNDRLSAEVAVLIRASRLIILTSVSGLLDEEGHVVSEVAYDQKADHLVRDEVGLFSVGGMRTKLEAARMATSKGITTVIANGREPGVLQRIAGGEKAGTWFLPAAPSVG